MRHDSQTAPLIRAAGVLAALAVLPVAGAREEEKKSAPKPLEIARLERAKPVDFQTEILPIFRRNCLACHNRSDAESDLVLETPESILKGGFFGPAVVPEKSMESLLLLAASHRDEPFMPPEDNDVGAKNLTPEELGLLKLWIDQGAAGSVTATDTARKWHPLPAGVNSIHAVAVSAGARLAACGRANQIFVYDLGRGELVGRLTDPTLIERGIYHQPGVAHLDNVQSLAFHPERDLLASGGYRTVKLWRRQRGSAKSRFQASATPILSIDASPDGRLLATGSEYGHIRIWDLSSGSTAEPVAVLYGHDAAVTGTRFLADGKRLVSGSLDGTVRSWHLGEREIIQRIIAPAAVRAIALLGESRVAAAGDDKVVRVWELSDGPTDGRPVAELEGHSGPVTSLASVPGTESQLLSGSEDGTVRHWDVAGKKAIRSVNHEEPVTAVAVRPDGKAFASAGAQKTVKLWNAGDGKLFASVEGDPVARSRLARRERRAKIFSDRLEAAKKAVEGAAGEVKKNEEALKKAIDALAKAEKTLAEKEEAAKKADEKGKKKAQKELNTAKSAAENARRTVEETKADIGRAAKVLERRKGELAAEEDVGAKAQAELESAQKNAAPSPARSLVFSGDGTLLVSVGDEGTPRALDGRDGSPRPGFAGESAPASAIALMPTGEVLSGTKDGFVITWKTGGDWELERTIGDVDDSSLLADRVLALDFSPDGSLLATGGGEPSRSGELKLWKVADGAPALDASGHHSDAVFSVDFSVCGRYLATGGADRFARVVRVADGKLLASYEGHSHHVLGVSWKADGRTLASCGADRIVKVWNVETREPRRTIGGFGSQVTDIHFVGDTQNIVSSCGDRTVRLHRIDNGKQIRSFGGAGDFVYAVAATPDGKTLVAGGYDSVLRVWNGENGRLVKSFEPPKSTEPVTSADRGAAP